MQREIELAYLGVECSDPVALGKYLESVIGLMAGEPTPSGALTWRVDGKAQRLIARKGTSDDAQFIGFEAVDDTAFERVRQRVAAHGAIWREGTARDCAERRVRRLVRTEAPWGVEVELVTGLAEANNAFSSPFYPEGFVTAGQGFGHAVFRIGDPAIYDESRNCAKALGLGLSDYLEMQLADGPMHVSFLHCNLRHHSLALACVPPSLARVRRLHHINFEVSSIAQVGAAFERALQSGTRIANTLGQHDNDHMVSFYGVTPAGWLIEVGATGRTIDDDWSDVRRYDRVSRWGHHPPARIAELQAPFIEASKA